MGVTYDKEADSLMVLWARNRPAISKDIKGEFWLRVAADNNEIIGIEIENFKAFVKKHTLVAI